jgi:hypothetical protein
MPKDRLGWNKSLGKGIDSLLNRGSASSVAASTGIDASAAVLQTSNLGESTQSTSNSIAVSQAISRARESLQQALMESEDDGDIDHRRLNEAHDFVYMLTCVTVPDAAILDYIGRIEQYDNHKLPESNLGRFLL